MQSVQLQLPILKIKNLMPKVLIISLLISCCFSAWSRDFSNAKVGDYIYENGNVSADKNEPTNMWGKCIGIIVSLSPTQEQLKLGYSHGTIMLLQDMPARYSLIDLVYIPENNRNCYQINNLPEYSPVNTKDIERLKSDRNGYNNTYNVLMPYSEAAHVASKVSLKNDVFSKCFIPSPAQWLEMMIGLGLAEIETGIEVKNGITVKSRLMYLANFTEDDNNIPSAENDKYLLSAQNSGCVWVGGLNYIGSNSYFVNSREPHRYHVSYGGPIDNLTKKRKLRLMCYF